MKITMQGLKQWSPSHTFRKCYLIEHKGKTIEYMPSNFEGRIFRKDIRNCLIRTLHSKKYNEVWA